MVDWLPADWPAPTGVRAGVSLRGGGVSEGPFASLNLGAHVGDDADRVAENRRRLRASLALPAEPAWLSQVHGTAVLRLDGERVTGTADAAVTGRPGVVCAVLTADCLPIVLARADGARVGVAHAGWRGLCHGVIEAAAAAVAEPGEPSQLLAWLGPAIAQPNFEVGDDVRDAFVERDPLAAACFAANERGRWQADLYGLARQRLAGAGISRVYGGGRCTFAEPDRFFSYRRDGQCGRLATLVWREAG